MNYRYIDLNSIKDKEQRKFYRQMKELYAIDQSKNEKQKINEIEDALLNGGDIEKIINDIK